MNGATVWIRVKGKVRSRIRENSDASHSGYDILETTERRSGSGGTLTRFRYMRRLVVVR